MLTPTVTLFWSGPLLLLPCLINLSSKQNPCLWIREAFDGRTRYKGFFSSPPSCTFCFFKGRSSLETTFQACLNFAHSFITSHWILNDILGILVIHDNLSTLMISGKGWGLLTSLHTLCLSWSRAVGWKSLDIFLHHLKENSKALTGAKVSEDDLLEDEVDQSV